MNTCILIDAVHPEEVRVALMEGERLEEFDFESESKKQIKSNIYLGKITRVEPSLQAAFVEYGGNRQGFLPFSEVHFDYYQIPVEDKKKLAEAVASAQADDDATLPEEDLEEDATETEEANEDGAEATEAEAEKSKPKRRRRLTAEERSALKKAEALAKAFAEEEYGDDEDATEAAEAAEDALDIVAEKESSEEIGGGDDDGYELRAKRSSIFSQYKVQEVLKRNQIILVQVIKEERGNKGASLSTYISLAGRYCVFMPNTNKSGGVSRRINDLKLRRKLKNIIGGLEIPEGGSVIMRTAGVDRTKKEIEKDFEYLVATWEEIRKEAVSSVAPALIHEEGNLIKRCLRDMFRGNVDEVYVQGKDGYKIAKDFMKAMATTQARKVKEFKEVAPIFKHYGIDSQLDDLYENEAVLPSGGSIVMTPTEALVSIDVNSGRATRERSIEDTAVKTNIEAAQEIARQLRLRDLAGLVVIDFIDMRELRNRRAVERALRDALKTDRAKIQVGRISTFGLLEMSRQRMRSSLVEASTTSCPRCRGTGVVRSEESTALKLLRAIEEYAVKEYADEVKMRTSTQAAFYLLNSKRQEILTIEEQHGVVVSIDHDHTLTGSAYVIDKSRSRRRKNKRGDEGASARKSGGHKKQASQSSAEVKEEDMAPRPKAEKPAPAKKKPGRKLSPSSEKVDGNVLPEIEEEAQGNVAEPHDKPTGKGKVTGGRGGQKRRKKPAYSQDDTRPVQDNTPTARDQENKPVSSGAGAAGEQKLRGLWKKITQ